MTCSKTKTKSNDSAKSGGNKKQSTSVELEEQYNSLFYFYLKLVKLLRENDGQENQRGGDDFEMIDELYPNAKKFKLHSDGSSKSAQPELNLTNQKVLCINIFEFLFNLFRKIKNSKENPSGSEKQMIQLMSSLMSNFNYLHSIHYLSSNSTWSSNEKLNNDLIVSIKQEHDDFLSRAFFYNLNLIHSELILHLFRFSIFHVIEIFFYLIFLKSNREKISNQFAKQKEIHGPIVRFAQAEHLDASSHTHLI